MFYSYSTRVHSYSLVSHLCSLLFTRILLVFTLLDLCSTRVHSDLFLSYLCSPLFTSVHSYSLVFYSCSLLFTRVHWCSTRVHWCSLVFYLCSLVFTGVHWCSFVFPFVWCFRLDLNSMDPVKVIGIRPLPPVQNSVSLKLMQRKTLNFVINLTDVKNITK